MQRFPTMRELLATLTFNPVLDPGAGPQVRRLVARSLPAFVVLAGVGLEVARRLGVSEVSASVAVTAALLAFQLGMLLRFRRMLFSNSFHRGVMTTGAVFAGQLLFLHAVGHRIGLSLSQISTLDLIAVLAMTCMMAPLFLPKLWPQIPIAVLAILTAVSYPAYAKLIASVMVPAVLMVFIHVWNDAVQLRNQTQRCK
jgi:hypothetical protein